MKASLIALLVCGLAGSASAAPDGETVSAGRQKIPKETRSDSIIQVIAAAERVDKLAGDEFAKTSSKVAAAEALRAKSYLFLFDDKLNVGTDRPAIQYDADAEQMTINLWLGEDEFLLNRSNPMAAPSLPILNLKQEVKESSFVGTNAYGAKTQVKAVTAFTYGVAFARTSEGPGNVLLSVTVPASPSAAKTLKQDVAFYVVVKLVPPDGFKSNVLETAFFQKATISNPHQTALGGRYVLAGVQEVGVYRKRTGEVLGSKVF